ncbi:Putative DNA-binding domain-containing protein [Solimonas aquatica]|uniref:Putative DNA-binding domain-containing protein n=1 Tax=Solimonas aquatica TaxID=489703 RepID=A0A1H9EQ72_9GAMM|nr:DNA-binding domain-containing protein [Solimonas aquatica]SEQ27737.1 Putative DNA-binding domain-containing protein [Solimonas aquatica]
MSTLAGLQGQFAAHILRGEEARALVQAQDQDDAARRLRVYHEAYRLRLIEVLAEEHGGLRALTGESGFDTLLRDYIEAQPSPHRNVRWYGEGLSAFLARDARWAQQPALAQMAALEWTLTLAFDAEDQPLLRIDDVANLSAAQWPQLKLQLAAHVHSQTLHWNLAAIREAVDAGAAAPDLQAQDPQAWAIWRRAYGVRYRALEAEEAALLPALREGLNFAAFCEQLRAWHEEEQLAPRAAGLLRRWIEDEWLRLVL